MDTLINFFSNSQLISALLGFIAIVGALVGLWQVLRRKKADGEGNIKIDSHIETKNIKTFEKYIDNSSWRKELINHKEFWICEEDNTFQIEYELSVPFEEPFTESWMQEFPQSYGTKYKVHLLIDRIKIKELIFVSTDGGNVFLPLPEVEGDENGRPKYYWERSSLKYRIGKRIGDFYKYDSLEVLARVSKIEIR